MTSGSCSVRGPHYRLGFQNVPECRFGMADVYDGPNYEDATNRREDSLKLQSTRLVALAGFEW